MKKTIFAAMLSGLALPAMAQVGVSVSVGQPGFYGQINIGSAPPPQLVYTQPVTVEPAPEFAGPPIYLHVPPGHEKHWDRHCAEYNACGRPVYFVRDDWYNNQYVPYYRHGDGGDEDHGHGHGHGHGHDDFDHGNGHGHGHGHDHDD